MTTASWHGTTIVSVRRGPLVALGGDGQVTLGNIVGGAVCVAAVYWAIFLRAAPPDGKREAP